MKYAYPARLKGISYTEINIPTTFFSQKWAIAINPLTVQKMANIEMLFSPYFFLNIIKKRCFCQHDTENLMNIILELIYHYSLFYNLIIYVEFINLN